ncbi:MAG TPA: hypothetical protein VFH55_08080 [Nitrospiria bacterium]|nr:hypothetical protein [Nitrospiria bacterium]
MVNREPPERFKTLSFFLGLSLSLFLGCSLGGAGAGSLTSEERQKITELVLSVAEEPEETVQPAREEIWAILKRHGTPSGRELEELKAQFLIIGRGHPLFWRDAREGLQLHRMVKSPDRARWEEGLARTGWLSDPQRVRFDDLMKRVIEEEPIPSNHGVDVSLSRQMVEEIVNSWDERELEQSVAALLTPPR